jgi:hypothetical protein
MKLSSTTKRTWLLVIGELKKLSSRAVIMVFKCRQTNLHSEHDHYHPDLNEARKSYGVEYHTATGKRFSDPGKVLPIPAAILTKFMLPVKLKTQGCFISLSIISADGFFC